ncbi:HCNGP-like protein-domain-containing protein [Dichomitus squalens]|uniref:HCNGP-like protein-domain-containing protein n=1 Tax=Dichomitus squalens TaxID=114155 RepID=A0A4Q9PM85_9APHY|nr:HCNGP-like protein-domain-containing protein [Dichomitus squalens]
MPSKAPPTAISTTGKLDIDLNPRVPISSDNFSRSTPTKPAVIIRRHAPAKPHLRTRVPEEQPDPGPSTPPQSSVSSQLPHPPNPESADDPTDELTRIRQLLRPPPIPGVQDWGIPPEPTEPCDEAIKAKITNFLKLKRDPQNPRHFNDSLMSNRAFRNPHLYTKLVEFVDVDERTTNFPKHIWDPLNVKEEWYADRIAEAQKARSEATSASQHSSQRSRIEFASASASAASLRQHRFDGGKPGRHQPYSVSNRGAGNKDSGEGVLGGGYGKGRGKSRWGW